MKWYDQLYVGDSIRGKEGKIRRMITAGKKLPYAYVIAFAANPDNLLDLIPAKELVQKGYPTEDIRVIGLAGEKSEAISMAAKIIEETWQQTGSCDVWAYLKEVRRPDP